DQFRSNRVLLGEGGTEEGEHSVTGNVREGRELEGVMPAVELQRAGMRAVALEGIQHLAAEFGEHGGVVFAVDEEGFAIGAETTLDVGHGANGCPVVAEFVNRDVLAKAFPDVVSGHTL